MEEQPLQVPDLPRSVSSGSHRQRSISLSSFHTAPTITAASTDLLHEPGWFSHAFHGSGACTCSLLLGSHHAEDHHPAPLVAVHHDDNDINNSSAPQVDNADGGGQDNAIYGENNGHDDDDDVDENGSSNTKDDVRNGPADGRSVGVRRVVGGETTEEIACENRVEDVEVVYGSNTNFNDGLKPETTENDINSLQHLTSITIIATTKGNSTEWCKEEWNDNRHHDRIVHATPPTSFSDETSLPSSSSSLSSSSSFEDNANHNCNHINDELITKVGDLAEENGILLDKCKKLEEELTAVKSISPSTQKERLHESKAVLFMAAISTTMIESFSVGNANLRKLSSFLSTAANYYHRLPAVDQSTASIKVEEEEEEECINESTVATASHKTMKPITEMRHEDVLELIQEMQVENDSLHKSIKESIQSVISESRERISALVEQQNATVEEYASKINGLQRDLNAAYSARDLLAKEIIMMKSENKTITSQLEETNAAMAIEFGAKIAALSDKLNESTSSKHELSREMELMRNENQKLSIELEEARSLVVASVHDEMKQELRNSENEEQALELEKLKDENVKLHESVKEMKSLVSTLVNKLSEESALLKDTQEFNEQQGEELNVEKMANTYLREEIDSISTEREEAYDACKVLQQEINLLRQKCAKMDERFDSDDSIRSSSSSKDNFSELKKLNDSLTMELEQKNEALHAVQSVLTSLKEEQSIIKKTITDLRNENAELRDTTSKMKSTSQPPFVPPPPPKSTLKHKTSLDSSSDSSSQSQILQLEVRLKKVEKENKGLREANNIMSTKLFDEMEKTESLKIANEGLGARICKLVKFIQQNSGGASSGSCGGEGAASASGISVPGKTR